MLPRRHFRQPNNSVLAHTVRRGCGNADLSRDTRQIHNTPALPCFIGFDGVAVDAGVHGAQLGADAVEDALAVNAEDEVEVVVGGGDDGVAVLAVHAGDVGGAVEFAELLDGAFDPGVDGGDVADVEDSGRVGARGGFVEGVGGRLQGSFVLVGEGERGTSGGEEFGCGETDARGGAGDGDLESWMSGSAYVQVVEERRDDGEKVDAGYGDEARRIGVWASPASRKAKLGICLSLTAL